MGNALQKASPGGANKHTILNNSQMSEAGNGDRSLLNVTDDNPGTVLINDPRSPTEGINRTPIQISRSKGLFRGMFSGRKPPEEKTESVVSAANDNKAAVTEEDEKPTISNGNGIASEADPVTASIAVTTSTPLSEGAVNGGSVHEEKNVGLEENGEASPQNGETEKNGIVEKSEDSFEEKKTEEPEKKTEDTKPESEPQPQPEPEPEPESVLVELCQPVTIVEEVPASVPVPSIPSDVILQGEEEVIDVPVIVPVAVATSAPLSESSEESENEHDNTTENEEALLTKKKKRKQREKAETKPTKVEAEVKEARNGDDKNECTEPEQQHHRDKLQVVKNANKQPLTKGYSDSKLAYSKCDGDSKNEESNSDASTKQRLANENDLPSSFRLKVEKACRSLTNLSSKGKTVTAITVTNGKPANGTATRESSDEPVDGDSNHGNSEEPCTTGASAPTTSPLVDIAQRDNVDCNGNANGKYMVLVNDE